MQINRRTFVGTALGAAAIAGLNACGMSAEGGLGDVPKDGKVLNGTYTIHVGGYDWGPGVDKAILTFDAPIDAVNPDDFVVAETKQVTDLTDETYPVVEVTLDRKVMGAYLADAEGNKVAGPSNVVVLDLYVSPTEGGNMVFNMDTHFATWSDPYFLSFALAEDADLASGGTKVGSVAIGQNPVGQTSDADVFKAGQFTTSSNITFEYVDYMPEEKSDALLVWLHGMGEGGGKVTGGSTPFAPVLGTKVTALAGDMLQNKVPLHVLVPHCPTVWSDIDGKMTNFQGGITQYDDCYYREALAELIDSYAKEVGATKILIAGCSAGGYMTMNMAVHYLDKYDAYIPICEAYQDSFISDEQIAGLVKVPMFFIHSEDDMTVPIEENTIPTLRRLQDAGAAELHSHISDKVVDTSGLYASEDGTPYEYDGHCAWIYFHNNEADCDECGIPVFDWIAEQARR